MSFIVIRSRRPRRTVYPVPMLCDCPRARLCAACVDRALYWHSGAAAARGTRWAESVARRRPDLLDQPWPALEGKALDMALRKVDDLSDDPRVLEQLAVSVDRCARQRWEELRAKR